MQHPSILTENALTKLSIISYQHPQLNLTVIKVMLQALHNKLLLSISSHYDIYYWENISDMSNRLLYETISVCPTNFSCKYLLSDLNKLVYHVRLIIQQGSSYLQEDEEVGFRSTREAEQQPDIMTLVLETYKTQNEYAQMILQQQAQMHKMESQLAAMRYEIAQLRQPSQCQPKQGTAQSQTLTACSQIYGQNQQKPSYKFQQPIFNTDSKMLDEDIMRYFK